MTDVTSLYPDHEKCDGEFVECPHCGDANLFVCDTSNLEVWNYCAVHRLKWCLHDRSSVPYGSVEWQNKGHLRNVRFLASFTTGPSLWDQPPTEKTTPPPF